jgi:hypothetical protein
MSQSFSVSGMKLCFTCASWGGSRTTQSSGAGNIYSLILENTSQTGQCMSHNNRGTKRAFDTCTFYSRLGNLA